MTDPRPRPRESFYNWCERMPGVELNQRQMVIAVWLDGPASLLAFPPSSERGRGATYLASLYAIYCSYLGPTIVVSSNAAKRGFESEIKRHGIVSGIQPDEDNPPVILHFSQCRKACGYHGDFMTVIMDSADGISDEEFSTFASILTGIDNKLLVVNTTPRPPYKLRSRSGRIVMEIPCQKA